MALDKGSDIHRRFALARGHLDGPVSMSKIGQCAQVDLGDYKVNDPFFRRSIRIRQFDARVPENKPQ